jgi:signal transduction histidine kinase
MNRRTPLVYSILLALWGLVLVWQIVEHRRVTSAARTALVNRSTDIAGIVSGVIGSATFRGIVPQDRLESALNHLVKPGELISVALLNATNEVVAYVGKPIDLEQTRSVRARERWGATTATFLYPVQVSATPLPPGETNRPTILVPPRNASNGPPFGGRRFGFRPPPPDGPPPDDNRGPRKLSTTGTGGVDKGPPRPVGNPDQHDGPRGRQWHRHFGRPWWMSEAEYQSLLEKRGLHALVLVMSTQSVSTTRIHDFWLRCIIGCFAGVSVAGLGLAWQSVIRSSELQIRLLRASELNTHLQEMNLAAAGLAHETRNPLNIIRGLAQMISKESTAAGEIQTRSREITDEVDRVTAQLNEFINYSRPREVRRAPVALGSVIADVVRALQSDIEDKGIDLKLDEAGLTVEADEQMLRQVLFNLLLNSIQAVEPNGHIQIVSRKAGSGHALLEIADDGPGVPAERRKEIFKPYFTTHQKGTGLGLAVVQQIVLAHGWDIECLTNPPRGAVFRLTGLGLPLKT